MWLTRPMLLSTWFIISILHYFTFSINNDTKKSVSLNGTSWMVWFLFPLYSTSAINPQFAVKLLKCSPPWKKNNVISNLSTSTRAGIWSHQWVHRSHPISAPSPEASSDKRTGTRNHGNSRESVLYGKKKLRGRLLCLPVCQKHTWAICRIKTFH